MKPLTKLFKDHLEPEKERDNSTPAEPPLSPLQDMVEALTPLPAPDNDNGRRTFGRTVRTYPPGQCKYCGVALPEPSVGGEFCGNLCESQWSWEIRQNTLAQLQLSGGPEGKKKLEVASLRV